MAYIDMVPASISLNATQGAARQIQISPVSSGGSAVNLSSVFATQVNVFPPNGSGGAPLALSSSSAFVGNSTGGLLELTAAELTAMNPGTYSINILAKALTGDDLQMVASGSLTVARSG